VGQGDILKGKGGKRVPVILPRKEKREKNIHTTYPENLGGSAGAVEGKRIPPLGVVFYDDLQIENSIGAKRGRGEPRYPGYGSQERGRKKNPLHR